MKAYKNLEKFIIGFLIFYFIAGLSTEVFLKDREKDIPPLFSWFLFIRTPNERWSSQYDVRLLEVDGKKLNSPVFFHQAYGIIENPNAAKPRELIRRLGSAIMMNSTEESSRLRSLLEQVYLPGHIRYQVVLLTYDPVERLATGEIHDIKILGEFNKVSP